MGIGGMAMGNVALLANQLGNNVLGSDTGFYPPLRAALSDAEIFEGYSAQRLSTLNPDMVVIGNVIGRGNEEIEWFWANKPCAYTSMSDFLRTQVIGKRPSVVVTGTHGKTTTTALTAYLMKAAGLNPGWMVGGVPNPNDLSAGANLGGADAPFVIEGDEYDTAFFDKRAKFISYTPTVAIVNNLELDHVDIYRDLEDIKRAFNHMLRTVPANGVVIANADDENVRDILPVKWAPTIWVGLGEDADVQIRNFIESEKGSCFDLYYKGQKWTTITSRLTGLYNARNIACAVTATAWSANKDNLTAFDPSAMLADYCGVNRRQQVRHNSEDLLVIEDFGHHPTAIEQTLASLQNRYFNRRWVVCFEPRSNTSRTNLHQQDLVNALKSADVAVIAPVYNGEAIAQTERLDTQRLATDLNELKGSESIALALSSVQQLPETLAGLTKADAPTAVVFFSNGNFSGQMDEFLKTLQEPVLA